MRLSAVLLALCAAVPALAESPEEARERLRERSAPFYAEPFVLGAHRGGQHEFPENTLYGFQACAKAFPGTLLEGDVASTKDGHVVMLHDRTVDRTTDGEGRVADLTLDEVQQLDAAYHFTRDGGETFPLRGEGIRVPLVREVLVALPNEIFLLEVKDSPETARRFIQIIRELGMQKRVIIGSFNAQVMQVVRDEAPGIGTCYDPPGVFRLAQALRGDWDAYVPEATMLAIGFNQFDGLAPTPDVVGRLQAKGILVSVHTVNKQEDLERYVAMGVDNVLTDWPSRLKAAIDAEQSTRNE